MPFGGIAAAKGFFAIRQHGRLKGVLLGKRERIGRISTGVVYEQAMKLSAAEDAMSVRRITVKLDKPTRDGDVEIHILTNLPSDVYAEDVASLYRHRWEEETAFNAADDAHMRASRYRASSAATFLFCLSMLAFNMRHDIRVAVLGA
ncbi:MAG: transposase [Pirellulaceae bacterium]